MESVERDDKQVLPHLSGDIYDSTDLRYSKLPTTNFWRAYVDRVDFTGADISLANFSDASLIGSCLDGATLRQKRRMSVL